MDDNKQLIRKLSLKQKKMHKYSDGNSIDINAALALHQRMMHDADIHVDLAVFVTIHDDNDFNKCDSENCNSLKRILTASTYYNKLDITENITHCKLFDDFIHNIYFDLVNDYIHFNNQHSSEIETIN
eukprot:175305_1